jgi:hypothetical protein
MKSPPCMPASDFPFTARRNQLVHLCELATDGTRNSLGRVDISEEALGVVLDLLDVEAKALVLACSGVLNTSDETILGASDAADAATDARADLDGVGEGDAWGAGLALNGFVDVGGADSRGLVLALEAGDGNVVADDVLFAVDAELVDAVGALEATSVGVVGVDDLVRGGFDLVGGGEVEGRLLGDLVLVVAPLLTPLLRPVLAPGGRGHGGGSHGGSDSERELHIDGVGFD